MTTEARSEIKIDRPVPVPDAKTKPYWDAAAEGQLAMQRCGDCGTYHNPPAPMCTKCFSSSLSYQPVSGRGTIYERVINHQAMVSGFQEAVPYAVVAVELEEQPGLIMLANYVGGPASEAQVGVPVEVTFEPLEGGIMLPQFQTRRS